MKILKEGQIQEKTVRWYKITCDRCKTEFTFSSDDPKVRIMTEKMINGKSTFLLICPLCSEKISGDLSDLLYIDLPESEEPSLTTSWNSIIKNYHWPNEEIWKRRPEYEPYYEHYVDYSNPHFTNLDCDKCPNKPDFKNGRAVVGDSPCDWCPKRQVYCVSKNTYGGY